MASTLEEYVVKKGLVITLSLAALALVACSQDQPTQSATPATPPAVESGGGTSGTVVETMNAAGYTYVLVDNDSEKIWAAAPAFTVAVGDSVVVPDGMPMHNYHSKTLNRDFPLVYFVDSVLNANAPVTSAAGGMGMPAGHPQTNTTAPVDVDLSNVQKAEGGLTVAEIFAAKTELSGQNVTLRAKVVKFSPKIMGKNWLHVQDGSGDAETDTHDLTVNTNVTAQVGDTVLISGPLTLDKDFGYGYRYNLIMEDAQVTVE